MKLVNNIEQLQAELWAERLDNAHSISLALDAHEENLALKACVELERTYANSLKNVMLSECMHVPCSACMVTLCSLNRYYKSSGDGKGGEARGPTASRSLAGTSPTPAPETPEGKTFRDCDTCIKVECHLRGYRGTAVCRPLRK